MEPSKRFVGNKSVLSGLALKPTFDDGEESSTILIPQSLQRILVRYGLELELANLLPIEDRGHCLFDRFVVRSQHFVLLEQLLELFHSVIEQILGGREISFFELLLTIVDQLVR